MKAKTQALLTFSLGLAAMAAAGLLAVQRGEHQSLARELAALPADAARAPRRGTPASPPGGGVNLLLKPLAAKDGDTARKELVNRLLPGGKRKGFQEITPLLESLSAEELLALIGTESAAEFAPASEGRNNESPEQLADAEVRAAALRRLCLVSPERALAVCAAGAPLKAPDALINVTAFAMKQRAREDPAAAIRWGRENSPWLPANWPGWVLAEVARTDSVASAAALARREGFLLAESMRWCGTDSLESINTLMPLIEAERAAAPEDFAENKLVRQGYQKIAEKISSSLGFEETRNFAEKWMAALPWREDVAILAVESTVGPNSVPETEAAADWMMDFVPEDRRPAAAEKLMYSLVRLGPAAFSQWLEKHQAAPWRDEGLAAFCRKIAPTSPDMAAQWAGAISNESLRTTTLAAFPKTP